MFNAYSAVRLKIQWYPNTSWTGNDISFNLRVIKEYFEPSYSDKMMDKNLLKVNDHERTMALLCLNSKKHLNEIWPLIKCQPLLREIVIGYIIIDNKGKRLETSGYKTLRSVHFGVVVVELINCKCGGIVRNQIRWE